jgi:hypothetical protein
MELNAGEGKSAQELYRRVHCDEEGADRQGLNRTASTTLEETWN